MKISIIIPTFNEEENLPRLVDYLRQMDPGLVCEIIVSDGGSIDGTLGSVNNTDVQVIRAPHKGRAAQMNFGAHIATGDVLYFLHADTFPPETYVQDIINAVNNDYTAGSYRLKFDLAHWFLELNCWFTRFDLNLFRFGDQSLFVTREVFFSIGGYNKGMRVLEDQEIIGRLKRAGKFLILKNPVTTSARRYVENGVYRLQAIYFLIFLMYKTGFSQESVFATYNSLIRINNT